MSERPGLELLLATRNSGKVQEISEALRGLPIKLRSLAEFPDVLPVEEVGLTYRENAILKAVNYSQQTRLCALADDSGLEVDVLDGMPGVFSARFGGQNVSDHQRIERLLTELSSYPDEKRTARFICIMALADWQSDYQGNTGDGALLHVVEGECEGRIARNPHGVNGFGFDPVFFPAGYNRTFAELPPEVKGAISHRGRALAAMRRFLTARLTSNLTVGLRPS